MESMSRNESYERMNKNFEKDALGIARTSLELRQAGLVRPAWYCPLLRGLGGLLVSLGTHLKTQNSQQTTLRLR